MRFAHREVPESDFPRFGYECFFSLEASLLLGHIEAMQLPRLLDLLAFERGELPNIQNAVSFLIELLLSMLLVHLN